ncbi:flagellar protein FliS [Ectothiorhodospira haloalkaliphila]|uniref:Flagellar secretion chaperone FliS n=1 Tax=Ectothiorhodospira haloalkaliphila TaxID=421628 RepID=W8KI16_9GAMM|nr:flagellar export chaperone FliS [Ectothiorhodospira haloalkaliphila]AHK79444.1 flagellar protein FliS [Ectothiorhodospira haloalkaliphila]
MTYAAMHRGINQYQQVGASGAAFADPHRLIEMLLDGGVDRLAQAKGAIARGDRRGKVKLIDKAFNIIGGLRGGLDMDRGGDIARNLDDLYDYMQRRLTLANAHDDVEGLDEVISLLNEVREGWKAIPVEARKAAPGAS